MRKMEVGVYEVTQSSLLRARLFSRVIANYLIAIILVSLYDTTFVFDLNNLISVVLCLFFLRPKQSNEPKKQTEKKGIQGNQLHRKYISN